MPDTTIPLKIRIERKGICFIKFLFECYEGVAVVETIDPKSGLICIHHAPGCEDMIASILKDVSRHYLIKIPGEFEPVHGKA